jgi:2-polyprenyl-6-hydroxyphenyl methylase/3-demethylubiquinone-9 3-methyltransferase
MAPHLLHNPVNNAVYDGLGERWYEAQDDPIALLRAETAHRTPWVIDTIHARWGAAGPVRVLDVGCGAGFLANALAADGMEVTGLDASASSLAVAERHDTTRSVRYQVGDACRLPYPDASFDVVSAMDFLEHVTSPASVIAEASRVLASGGLFFFHTFNRTFLSWLVVIKGVEWFVKNTPPRLHVHSLFCTPAEVRGMCTASGLTVSAIRGQRPAISSAFFRMLATGAVPGDFAFCDTTSTATGYMGVAIREPR